MVFVLLLLVFVLSALTLQEQNPTGAEAGRIVAKEILAKHGADANVAIITESTSVDTTFVDGAIAALRESGATVVASVSGKPRDARQAIDQVLAEGRSIDAIAATGDTAAWTIYDRCEAINRDNIVSPVPYNWPTFARLDNLLSVANQTAIYAIIAIGMTMVIITAGIDLSVGSLVALASVAAAISIRDLGDGREAGVGMMLLGCLIGMGVCALAGLFNGVMITRFRIPPFIATLSMMMMAKGLALRLSAGESISAVPDSFRWIGGGSDCGDNLVNVRHRNGQSAQDV